MKRHIQLVIYLIATLFAQAALAQVASTPLQSSSGNSPIAYIYVSRNVSNTTYELNAYRAAPDGKLTPVVGSPFSADVGQLAVSQKHIFGTNGVDIDSFSIASNGAPQQVDAINAQQFNTGDCGGPTFLFLDRTGATVYDLDYYSDCANNAYQFFSVGASTGDLSYLGVTAAATPSFEWPLSFLKNNEYAYGASCYHWYQLIYGFVRGSDGALAELNNNPTMPASDSGQFYCPGGAATDDSNHLAVGMQADNNSTFQPVGLPQLASYTADSSGNLTTTSTYSNMPTVTVGIDSMAISPSGRILAVGGTTGLQLFHFNGSDPITHYTGALTTEQITQLAWDNNNHLYALSPTGKLFVFTVTPTGVNAAPGSPYSITNPQGIAVLPE
jgi:hypothetical protein